MTLEEKCELLRPMRPRDAVHSIWLTDALVRTDGARARLRRWVEAGFPPAPDVARTCIDGPEPEIRRAIIDAIGRIDVPPVWWHVSRHVVFMTTGRHTGGWQGLWPVFAHPVDEPGQTIVVCGSEHDPEELASNVAHEIAHAWLADVAHASPLVSELADYDPGRTSRLAREWHISDEAIAQALVPLRLSEHRAATLAREWGFTGRATDPDRCAKRYRFAE